MRDLPPIARKLYGIVENDRFETGEEGREWQAYWLGAPLFASLGSTCARERDNAAAVWRACEAIQAKDSRYAFTREKVYSEKDRRVVQQLVVTRASRPRIRPLPRPRRAAG